MEGTRTTTMMRSTGRETAGNRYQVTGTAGRTGRQLGTRNSTLGTRCVMIRIDFADGSHNYFAWDADSKRVAADDSSGHTDFIYRDPDPLSLIMERDGAGQTKATYTLGDGLEAMRRNGTVHFYHFDWLGSTFALTDANEDITDTWRYDAWGNVLVRTGLAENPHTYVGRLRYYWRPDPLMYLLGVRMYDQRLGRFAARDPGHPSRSPSFRPFPHGPLGANLYVYSTGEATRSVDPGGRRACCPRSVEPRPSSRWVIKLTPWGSYTRYHAEFEANLDPGGWPDRCAVVQQMQGYACRKLSTYWRAWRCGVKQDARYPHFVVDSGDTDPRWDEGIGWSWLGHWRGRWDDKVGAQMWFSWDLPILMEMTFITGLYETAEVPGTCADFEANPPIPGAVAIWHLTACIYRDQAGKVRMNLHPPEQRWY